MEPRAAEASILCSPCRVVWPSNTPPFPLAILFRAFSCQEVLDTIYHRRQRRAELPFLLLPRLLYSPLFCLCYFNHTSLPNQPIPSYSGCRHRRRHNRTHSPTLLHGINPSVLLLPFCARLPRPTELYAAAVRFLAQRLATHQDTSSLTAFRL
jgi:hypothetical protein